MAVRKFILVTGQSNATEEPPAQSWEDENPYLSLRSPQHVATKTPQFANGAYNDLITLPYTFNGGQQLDVLGDGADYESDRASQWQYVNVLGTASQALRYLTFYDPSASYWNKLTTTSVTSTYPGTGMILEGSTAKTLKTSVYWQLDPNNVKITRQRTGQTHTVDSTAVGTSIEVSPPLVPPPETGELFTYEVEAVNAGSSTTQLVFKNRFGGQAFDTSDENFAGYPVNDLNTAGRYSSYISQIRNADGTKDSARVTCRSRIVTVGDIVFFTNNAGGTVANITDILEGSSNDYHVTRVGEYGETKSVAATDWDVDNDRIRLSGHKLGYLEPIQFTGSALGGLSQTVTYYVDNQIAVANTAWDDATHTLTLNGHGLQDSDVVVFSNGGTMPTGGTPPATDTVYYVKATNDNTIELYTEAALTSKVTWTTDPTSGSATITLPNSFRVRTSNWAEAPRTLSGSTGACTITRLDSYGSFYISEDIGQDEVQADADSGRDNTTFLGVPFGLELQLGLSPFFRGSLTGLQARCIDGASQNEGEARNLGDVTFTGSLTKVSCEAFPVTPTDNDTFVIEPQGQVAEFHKWAMWLPWCPFEGKARYVGPSQSLALTNESFGLALTFAEALGITPTVGSKIRIYTSGTLLAPLQPGKDYFIASVNILAVAAGVTTYVCTLSETYNGDIIQAEGLTGSDTGKHNYYVVDSLGKGNPFPPGFNYPNHYATPRPYQPFDGTSYIAKPPSAALHTSLGYRFYEHYGEVFNIALSAIGQSSVGHKEVRDVSTILTGHSWYDRMQFKSWSPGEPNNCFSRVLDTLDAAKTAFEAEGDTGECVGIFYAQGETDAFLPRLADNYENGMRKLKAAMRQAVKERGLTSLDEDKIPFIHPQIKNYDIYPGTEVVNAAITALADEDPYSRTVSVDGVDLLPNDVHYTGKGMSLLGDRCYEAWKDIQRSGSSEVDICNLALTNIGDKATVTSINPSDGSHQADLCARYYPLARDLLLERHRWDFTIRHVSPVALTASGRTDWAYAFKLPSNFTGVISVLPKDSTDDQITQGTASPQPFAIESNASLDRVLYTNEPEVILRYQAKITDSTKFSQMFVHAVSWQLASMLAGALIKGDDGAAAVQNATRMAEFYTAKASAYDSRSTREKPVVDGNINPWDR